MVLLKRIEKMKKMQEDCKVFYNNTKKECYYKDFISLDEKINKIVEYIDYIQELVQMGYNNDTFQVKFYEKFADYKNDIELNYDIMDTKKYIEEKINS